MASETPLIWRWYSPIAWIYVGVLSGHDDAPPHVFLISGIGLLSIAYFLAGIVPPENAIDIAGFITAVTSIRFWIVMVSLFFAMHSFGCILKGWYGDIKESYEG